jgi:hypothetical protein
MIQTKDVDPDPVESIVSTQPPRLVWFFCVRDGDDVGYMSAEYGTTNHAKACRTLEHEYGVKTMGSVLRELSWHEYCGLLAACNIRGDHGEKVANAIKGVFFKSC